MNRIDWATAQRQAITISLAMAMGYVGLQAASYLRDELTVAISAMLVAYLLQLAVRPLERFMPRQAAIGLVIVLLLVFGGIGLAVGLPLVLVQIRQLLAAVPVQLDRLQGSLTHLQIYLGTHHIDVQIDRLDTWLTPRLQAWSQQLTDNLLGMVAGGFFGFFMTAMILVCAFYFLKDGQMMWRRLMSALPPRQQRQMAYLGVELQRSLHDYFRGQVLNASVVLAASLIAFMGLGMNFAIVGALLWGALEVIPYFGTYGGITSALLLASMQGETMVGKVAIACILIWWTKDNIIAPRVMSHTTGLHPVVIVLAVLTGGKVAGFLGVLLAIPLTAVLVGAVRFYLHTRRTAQSVAATGPLNLQGTPAPGDVRPAS